MPARRLDLRLHQHQGAAHVRVVEQARGQGAGPGRAALLALQREGQRRLVGALGEAHALDAHLQARGVHHHEHVGEALVRGADQFRRRALVEHDAGGGGVDAELVLQARRPQRVGDAERAVLAHPPLGGEEQAQAPRAGRRVGQARQHQVDDVLGDVVVAPGDVDLLAGEAVAALAVGLGAGGDRAEVGAGLGLGEHHHPGPLAGDQLGQIERLLPVGAVQRQRLDRRQGQHRAQAEGHVGPLDHLEHRRLEGAGQALAAVVRMGGKAVPAPLRELAVGVGEAGRGPHLAVLQPRADLVALVVDGREDVGRQGAGALQHRARPSRRRRRGTGRRGASSRPPPRARSGCRERAPCTSCGVLCAVEGRGPLRSIPPMG